jgi:hypothetical protein
MYSKNLSDHFFQFTYFSGGLRGQSFFSFLTHLIFMCLSCMKRKRSKTFQNLRIFHSTTLKTASGGSSKWHLAAVQTAAKCHMRRLSSVAKCGVARSFSGSSSEPSE